MGEEREWACHRTQGVPSCDEEDVEGIRPVLVRAGDQWETGEVIREGQESVVHSQLSVSRLIRSADRF